jgi:hypothetical protein
MIRRCWQDLSEEKFTDFSQEIEQRRQKFFSIDLH